MSHAKKVNNSKKKKLIVKKEEDIDLASELFEETIDLAIEENSIGDAKQFAEFVVDMIPEEILGELKLLAGVNDDDKNTEEDNIHSNANKEFNNSKLTLNSSTFRFLEDIWIERFQQKTVEVEEQGEWNGGDYVLECELCERTIQTTRHHVYPKETHDWLRKKNENHYGVYELRKTVSLCRMCHSAIHRFFSNRELAIEYYSLELLLDSELVCKFAKWASGMQGRGNLRTR
mmetsp:Transcript_20378/g.19691  ORF Transcript_20378/g.19691 Transcript_20378/m.19691 type:complete len:231 (+) Transcript_20378:337-1029(+)